MLLFFGGRASGVRSAASWRVQCSTGRRRQSYPFPRAIHRVRTSRNAFQRRQSAGIFFWVGWLCTRRGLRSVVVEALVGGAIWWRPDFRFAFGFSGEPGRSVERSDSAERLGAAVVVAGGASPCRNR